MTVLPARFFNLPPAICRFNCSNAGGATSAFFCNDTATTEIYTLSLHDALPICVRAEQEAHREDVVVQIVLHEAGLHPGPQLLGVHLEDAVHVARAIEHERVIDGLAGERRPAAARQNRDAELAGHLDRGLDVVGVSGNDDAHGLDLIHGGVGRVEEAGSLIEPDVSADSPAELTLEVVHGVIILGGHGPSAAGTIAGWPLAGSPSSSS